MPGLITRGSPRAFRAWPLARPLACKALPLCRLPSLTWTVAVPPACSSLPLPDAVVVRFGGQTFGSPVRSSPGYRSMSVVSASLWHVTGTVCSPPPGPACSPSPGLVSPCVHTYEDQHDEHKDADHKPPIAREADVMGWPAAHYVAPTEELQSGRIHSLTIRLKCRAFHLLEPAPSLPRPMITDDHRGSLMASFFGVDHDIPRGLPGSCLQRGGCPTRSI